MAFPAASQYEGTVRSADRARPVYASQAVFHGYIVVTSWPRAEVAALVPDPLALADPRSPDSDEHPVVFLFGDQRYGAAILGSVAFPSPVVYQEFTMAVPFVRHRGGNRLHTYVPRMICSYAPATWTGNAYYGFGKRMGTLDWRGPLCAVCDAEGKLLLHAHLEHEHANAELPPNFDAIRELFDLPIVGQRDDGRWIQSHWSFDFSGAQVSAADALVEIDSAIAEGVRPQAVPDLERGSVHVDGMVWRLSLPVPLA